MLRIEFVLMLNISRDVAIYPIGIRWSFGLEWIHFHTFKSTPSHPNTGSTLPMFITLHGFSLSYISIYLIVLLVYFAIETRFYDYCFFNLYYNLIFLNKLWLVPHKPTPISNRKPDIIVFFLPGLRRLVGLEDVIPQKWKA